MALADSKSPIVVKMLDMPLAFDPAHLTVKVGDTVTWQNTGNVIHHATSDPSAAMKADEVAMPNGAKPFDSGFLHPGESFSYTFTVPGTYKYVCVPHEMSGMVGEIIVTSK